MTLIVDLLRRDASPELLQPGCDGELAALQGADGVDNVVSSHGDAVMQRALLP